MKQGLLVLLLLGLPGICLAQQSASFDTEEQAFVLGGGPRDGASPSSASFRVTIHSLGTGIALADLGSASFRTDLGFVTGYVPPGEVAGLMFQDPQTLFWDPERSVGTYNLYRDLLSNLSGLSYGLCEQQGLPSATASDAGVPPSGDGYFYLATAVNRLAEEGTKGFDSSQSERLGSACP